MAAKKRAMTREDLLDFKFMRGLDISPDGTKVVYTLEWIDKKENKYYSNLWVYDCAKDSHTQFTFGNNKDREPRFSPGGGQILFCSSREKQDGIYLISASGGSERNLLKRRGSLGAVSFSSDGANLVFQFRKSHNAPDEETEAKIKESEKAPAYRHITRLFYRLDGDGWRPDDGYHIWRYDLRAEKAIQVTRGKWDEGQPVWAPDGKHIAFITNHHKDPDKYLQYQDIFVCDLNGNGMRKIAKPDGPAEAPAFSPDGKYLAYIGHDNPKDAWGATNLNLWIAPLTGGPAKNLTKKFDTTLTDVTISDMGEHFGSLAPVWSANGARLYFAAPRHGSNELYSISRSGGKPVLEAGGKFSLIQCRADKRRQTFALAVADPKSSGDLWLFDATGRGQAALRRVSDVNAELFKSIQITSPQEVWFKSYDGTKVHGWIIKPYNFKSGKKYPAIVEVHGGPRAQYGNVLFHEMQHLAAKGYVVFYTNPRGSQGYGEKFTRAIVGDWGGPDYEDVMAGTDFLAKQPYVNPKRIGITGGSYGGYMTNWVVGHTNRFKAAVTQRSVVNLVSFFGSSDIGYDTWDEFSALPWGKTSEELVRMSPSTYVHKIRTPLLILHNENDLRCGIEQAEELYASLKYLGRKVEFVRFPEEPHGLSRMGRPDRRMARLKFIGDWFDKYLKR
jgi:dipeptidyl aminopeptidase/acylaminoacyl peptidase